MVVNHVLASSLLCGQCRLSLAKRFIALSANAHHSVFDAAAPVKALRPRRRAFGSSARSSTGLGPVDEKDDNQENVQAAAVEPEVALTGKVTLPWYLQNLPKLQEDGASHPISERQRLPELPNDPPPILQPILEHISTDLGLDNLVLLDLRKLDPPPALGGNLLMIVGTARSEKHLHVSADRHCRWLRSTYKLSPYADGLLGRNELKLKLRRRARRSRMYKSVGAQENETVDDGIRTGWVCVNVGRVKAAENVRAEESETEDFVGFGRRSTDVGLVVQMFTEEKRSDVDLEGLWQGILRRANKDGQWDRVAETARQQTLDDRKRSTSDNADSEENISSLHKRYITSQFQTPNAWNMPRVRSYHSSAALHMAWRPASASTLFQQNPITGIDDGRTLESETVPDDIQGNSSRLPNQRAADSVLADKLQQLKLSNKRVALSMLGAGAEDKSSTPFLASFYSSAPLRPAYSDWICVVSLHCRALELGHPGYTARDLRALLLNVRISGFPVSQDLLLHAFKSSLIPVKRLVASGQPVRRSTIGDSIEIMEMMYDLGYDPVSPEIILAIHAAVVMPESVNLAANGRATAVAWQDRLHWFMDLFGIDFKHDRPYLELLRQCAAQQHWKGFWDIWKGMARRMYARSADLYAFFFRTMAGTRHQARCMLALRVCVPEMEMEIPQVLLKGEVAAAVMECLLVVEPKLKDFANTEGVVAGEWTSLWRRCQQGLRPVPAYPSNIV